MTAPLCARCGATLPDPRVPSVVTCPRCGAQSEARLTAAEACHACHHAVHALGVCPVGWTPFLQPDRSPGLREDAPGSGCTCGEQATESERESLTKIGDLGPLDAIESDGVVHVSRQGDTVDLAAFYSHRSADPSADDLARLFINAARAHAAGVAEGLARGETERARLRRVVRAAAWELWERDASMAEEIAAAIGETTKYPATKPSDGDALPDLIAEARAAGVAEERARCLRIVEHERAEWSGHEDERADAELACNAVFMVIAVGEPFPPR